MSKRDSLLRVALLGNAAFSTACVVVLAGFADRLSPHLSAPSSWLYALAVGLGLFAASLVWQATRPVIRPLEALLTSAGDFVWVVGSAVLLIAWPDAFTSLGTMLVEGVALVVLAAGVAQLVGLRRIIAEPDPSLGTRCRVEVEVDAWRRESNPALAQRVTARAARASGGPNAAPPGSPAAHWVSSSRARSRASLSRWTRWSAGGGSNRWPGTEAA